MRGRSAQDLDEPSLARFSEQADMTRRDRSCPESTELVSPEESWKTRGRLGSRDFERWLACPRLSILKKLAKYITQ